MAMPFRLSRSLQDSPAWRVIETELRTQLQNLRERNDAEQTPERTAFLRGQIAQVKACLQWAADPPLDT